MPPASSVAQQTSFSPVYHCLGQRSLAYMTPPCLNDSIFRRHGLRCILAHYRRAGRATARARPHALLLAHVHDGEHELHAGRVARAAALPPEGRGSSPKIVHTDPQHASDGSSLGPLLLLNDVLDFNFAANLFPSVDPSHPTDCALSWPVLAPAVALPH
jgi:hypothetical protein